MKKKLFFLLIIIISAFAFFPGRVNAQGIFPTGGDSFETAVPLSLGNYQGGTLEEDSEGYYLIDSEVKPGQEIQVQVLFGGTNLGVFLYNQNRQKLTAKEYVGEDDDSSLYWLNGASSPQKYYFRVKNQAINAATLKSVSIKIVNRFSNDAIWSATLKNVNIKVVDRFDAGSQTDAGGSFENALPIGAGQYQGYLDFNYEASDKEDFYKVNLERGQKLTVKVTPPQDLYIELRIYDKNRSELVNQYSENEGAIITGSIQALTADVFYFAVAPAYEEYMDQPGQYSLDISGATPETEKSGAASVSEDSPENPLPQISTSPNGTLGNIGKNIKPILLIIVTVLVIIIVTVVLLLKGKSGKKEVPEKEKEPMKEEEVKEKEEKTVKPEFVYCSKCGEKNPQGARFCSKCGEELS